MSLPYYISDTVKDWLKEVDSNSIDTIYTVFGEYGEKSVVDEKTNTSLVGGVITLLQNERRIPVVVVAGHVYDICNRIYNKEFDSYYILMGITGIDIEKSRYLMTQEMLRFFIKEDIKFLPEGETLLDLKKRKVESYSSYGFGAGWRMA